MLSTVLDLRHLRPAIQPGGELDHEWPPELVTLMLQAAHVVPREMRAFDAASPASVDWSPSASVGEGAHAIIRLDESNGYVNLQIALPTGEQALPELSLAFRTDEDDSPRALPLNRFLLPWVTMQGQTEAEAPTEATAATENVGGSWGRGRRLFYDERTQCGACHPMRGTGPSIAPDLANLVHRDFVSVLRDIENPSFAINPDYLGALVTTVDGRVLSGVVQSQGDQLLIGDEAGRVTRLPLDEVERMQPMQVSVMPTGLLNKLDAEEQRDLLTFLTNQPPSMPQDSPLPAPPVRTRAEVAVALNGASHCIDRFVR